MTLRDNSDILIDAPGWAARFDDIEELCRRAVDAVLAAAPAPLAEAALATRVIGKRAWKKHLSQIVATLEALGRVRRQGTLLLSAGQPRRTNRHPRRRG